MDDPASLFYTVVFSTINYPEMFIYCQFRTLIEKCDTRVQTNHKKLKITFIVNIIMTAKIAPSTGYKYTLQYIVIVNLRPSTI